MLCASDKIVWKRNFCSAETVITNNLFFKKSCVLIFIQVNVEMISVMIILREATVNDTLLRMIFVLRAEIQKGTDYLANCVRICQGTSTYIEHFISPQDQTVQEIEDKHKWKLKFCTFQLRHEQIRNLTFKNWPDWWTWVMRNARYLRMTTGDQNCIRLQRILYDNVLFSVLKPAQQVLFVFVSINS